MNTMRGCGEVEGDEKVERGGGSRKSLNLGDIESGKRDILEEEKEVDNDIGTPIIKNVFSTIYDTRQHILNFLSIVQLAIT